VANTSGIIRQVSRSNGAIVCRAAAAYNAFFALRIALILFPMTLPLYFLETFIIFTCGGPGLAPLAGCPLSHWSCLLGVHPLLIYWEDAPGGLLYRGLRYQEPRDHLIEPVCHYLSREGHCLPDTGCLLINTSIPAISGATVTGINPEGALVVGAGVGTGASAVEISALWPGENCTIVV
jgi:hypothetical protein